MHRSEARGRIIQLQKHATDSSSLVARIKQRDPVAAAEFYDLYARKVDRLVWRTLGGDASHDDVVQTAFEQMLKSIGRLKAPELLDQWVVSVTLNTVRKEIRSRRRSRIFMISGEAFEAECSGADPAEREIVARVYSVLGLMKDRNRLVFVLRYVEQYTAAEIASYLGCSLATAKRYIVHAKRAFWKRARRDEMLTTVLEEAENDV